MLDPKYEMQERLREQSYTCPLCRRSRHGFPGLKFAADRTRQGRLRGVLCTVCKKGIDAFPEPAIMFQAIKYLRDCL